MAEVFLNALNGSFVCGWLILCVLLVRFLFQKASKTSISWLWILLTIRLLIPARWSGSYKAYNLYPFQSRPIPLEILYQESPSITTGIGPVDRIVSGILPAGTPAASVNPLQIWAAAGAWIWILGAVGMLGFAFISVIRLRWSLRGARRLERGVYEAGNLRTPFVLGLLPPRIYLPEGLTEPERRLVVAHERAHIREIHHWIRAAAYVGLCIHWFNPLVWLAYRLLEEDTEICCDEQATLKMTADEKKAYAGLLLSMAADRRMGPLAFGECNVKKRIQRLLKAPPPGWLSLTACFLVAVIYAFGLRSSPQDLMANMRWLRNLRADEVKSIALYVTGAPYDKRYRNYAREEFPQVLSFLGAAEGEPVRGGPGEWEGPTQTFWVQTQDGHTHWVGSLGNTVFRIDGVCYTASPWLESWEFVGDEPVPVPERELAEGSPQAREEIRFSSDKKDPQLIGEAAASAYFEALKQAPAEQRIASYTVKGVTWLAGDQNAFCVSVYYDFTSADSGYFNPALGLTGVGGREDCYLELRVAKEGAGRYLIESAGTGGVAQGLAPAPEWFPD